MAINEISPRVTAGLVESTPRAPSPVPEAPVMPPPAAAVRETSRQVDRVDLSQAVEKLNTLVQQVRRELRFSVDDASGHVIIRVFDSETNQLVRQIPPDQVLTVMERLQGNGPAMMLDARA